VFSFFRLRLRGLVPFIVVLFLCVFWLVLVIAGFCSGRSPNIFRNAFTNVDIFSPRTGHTYLFAGLLSFVLRRFKTRAFFISRSSSL